MKRHISRCWMNMWRSCIKIVIEIFLHKNIKSGRIGRHQIKIAFWVHISATYGGPLPGVIFRNKWAAATRLLHSPNLVVIGLSVGLGIWLTIGCHRPFCDGWSKYRLVLPLNIDWDCIMGSRGQWDFPLSWWRHQMESFSALLALYAGNSPVPATKASDAELWCFLSSTPE